MYIVFLIAIALSAILTTFTVSAIHVPVTHHKVNSHIVQLKQTVSLEPHITDLLSSIPNAKITYKYKDVFHGYAVKLRDEDLAYVRKSRDVEHIFKDQVLNIGYNASVKSAAGHISHQPKLPNVDDRRRASVTIYIISTGVYIEHSCFEGRASRAASPFDGDDITGIGTHLAGVVAGNPYGLAWGARIVSVKIGDLMDPSTPTVSRLIATIAYVARDARTTGRPSIATIPFSVPINDAFHTAVRAASRRGVHFTAAAGDESMDASLFHASMPGEMVSAVDSDNHPAEFANYGSSVTIWAHGVDFQSAWIGGPFDTNLQSSTGVASARVAGILAREIIRNGTRSPEDLRSVMLRHALPSVTNAPDGSTHPLVLASTTNLLIVPW